MDLEIIDLSVQTFPAQDNGKALWHQVTVQCSTLHNCASEIDPEEY
jgi:hypothetical protein